MKKINQALMILLSMGALSAFAADTTMTNEQINAEIKKLEDASAASSTAITTIEKTEKADKKPANKKQYEVKKDVHRARIAANRSQIAELRTRLLQTQLPSRVEFDQLVQNSSTGMQALSDDVQSVKDHLASFEKQTKIDIRALERGLAAQAALSGLFQPYSVGKFNVTAAVGNYKTRTAFAVGAGYRVNEHFAVKTGVALALDNNNPTSHIGVNYEF